MVVAALFVLRRPVNVNRLGCSAKPLLVLRVFLNLFRSKISNGVWGGISKRLEQSRPDQHGYIVVADTENSGSLLRVKAARQTWPGKYFFGVHRSEDLKD